MGATLTKADVLFEGVSDDELKMLYEDIIESKFQTGLRPKSLDLYIDKLRESIGIHCIDVGGAWKMAEERFFVEVARRHFDLSEDQTSSVQDRDSEEISKAVDESHSCMFGDRSSIASCPYLFVTTIYHPDLGTSYRIATCKHPAAPDGGHLGTIEGDYWDFFKIPEWCPMKRH